MFGREEGTGGGRYTFLGLSECPLRLRWGYRNWRLDPRNLYKLLVRNFLSGEVLAIQLGWERTGREDVVEDWLRSYFRIES